MERTTKMKIIINVMGNTLKKKFPKKHTQDAKIIILEVLYGRVNKEMGVDCRN